MGYQIWISPVTGDRRTGTRLTEVRSLLGAGVTARAIVEPLWCCPADAPAEQMKQVLQEREFDLAGVKDYDNGAITGFVDRAALAAGTVRDHLKVITCEHLISDATPLADLLTVLQDRERVLVLVGSEVRAIVTQADLNKPPVRVYLF